MMKTIEHKLSPLAVCSVLFLLGFTLNAFGQFGDPVPRYPQEVDGLISVKSLYPYFSETDIAVPGRGLGLEFTRHYNGGGLTRSAYKPAFLGYYWYHTYQWELQAEYILTYVRNEPYERESWSVITGAGEKFQFNKSGVVGELLASTKFWNSYHDGELTVSYQGEQYVLTFTTKHGLAYKFETFRTFDKTTKSYNRAFSYVLTEISDPNGNRLRLHYEESPRWTDRYRLLAVEDTAGRFLKFYYRSDVDGNATHQVNKIEFGKGTKAALTTVYQTITYQYPSGGSPSYRHTTSLTSVRYQLGAGDPRGAEIVKQYEYNGALLNAIVSPLGHRTEITYAQHYHTIGSTRYPIGKICTSVRHLAAPAQAGLQGEVLHHRRYEVAFEDPPWWTNDVPDVNYYYAYDVDPKTPLDLYIGTPVIYPTLPEYPSDWSTYPSSSRRHYRYRTSGSNMDLHYPGGYFRWRKYGIDVTDASQVDGGDKQWYYHIDYDGDHNEKMGNPTKWAQIDPADVYAEKVLRQWTADYEKKYNRPIWQIDPMGHKTEFTYDTNGNLTEVRSKANTGTQPHTIAHDIVTTHQYDAYGNRIKTTVKPSATVTQVVQTVYDSTHHTYPIEVKTTITKDGASHTIKTKSEWDVNRGLKTADIDALGNRTEYAYWKDRTLKYTKDVAADLYTVPTYDKDGNVTQVQVRQTNWQTGTIVAQKKTEHDGMGRVTKVHSFKDSWTTPYATTEATYDVYGDIATTKDPRGLITTYTYNELGQLTKTTLPDGGWTETRYNTLSQPTKSWTKANGTEARPLVSYTYDIFNRLKTTTYRTGTQIGESVVSTYDLGDNRLTLTTNDGSTSYTYTYTHDQLNRVITRNDSLLGYKTFYEYDDASRRTRMHIRTSTGTTDLYDVTYTYDKANRLTAVKDVLANQTANYDYFDIGALKTTALPNGITATRTLDTRHRLDELTYKTDATTTLASLDYTYDVKSNVTKLVKNDTGAGGSSKTFTFGYDKISRLTSANYGTETVSYTYDKSGNRLTQVSTVDGTTTYTVATDSNQLTYRSLVPESSDFSTMNYTYDAEGKLTKRYQGSNADTFTYGFGSKLKGIDKTRTGKDKQTVSYGYDGAGRRVKVTDSAGTRYFLYDGGMPLLELDANKKITHSYLTGADGVVYRYTYAKIAKTPVARWYFDEGKGTTLADIDGSNDGTLGSGDAAPTWHSDSGLTFDGSDDQVKVPDSDGLDLAGSALTISVWVQRGRTSKWLDIVKKTDAQNGYQFTITPFGSVQFKIYQAGSSKRVTSKTALPFDQWYHLCARYDGSVLEFFVNGTKERTETTTISALSATTEPLWIGGDTKWYFKGVIDDLLIYDSALSDTDIAYLAKNRNVVDTPRYEYHHLNALGSPIVLTDGRKTVLARYDYDVFGAIRTETGTSDNVRKFTGKEWDADSNLYYFAARYYDPYIGRFNQRDPAGQGINWYVYGNNNPLKFTDPTGMWFETLIDIVGLGISVLEFIKNPSIGNAGWVAVDAGAVLVPFIPGTQPGRIVAKIISKNDPAKAFKGVTKFGSRSDQYRANLMRLSGVSKATAKAEGLDAHHILPKKFEAEFMERFGVNVHEPWYMTWWKRKTAGGTHEDFAREYEGLWRKWLDENPNATIDDLMGQFKYMADKYINEYYNSKYYIELYQVVPASPSSNYMNNN